VKRQWVLLRGLAREQGHWGEFKTRLEAADPASEVLTPDLPGCGIYHRLSCPHKISGLAEFVHSHLKNPKPAERYLVAISLGGMIASELLRLYPHSFDGLVVINTSFKNLSPVHHRLQMKAMWHLLRAATAGSELDREKAVLEMVSNRPDKNDVAREWAALAKEHPVSAANFVKQLIAAMRYELPEEKPQIPVLVLTSDGDRMVNSECSKKLAQTWGTLLEVHPSAGHELCLDDPEWVVQRLQRFFKI